MTLPDSHTIRPHGKLTSSWANIWPNCFGSYALKEELGPFVATDAMKRGTFVHEVCESKLNKFLQYKLTGRDIILDIDTSWDDEAIKSADTYVKLIWKNVLEEQLTGKAYGIEELLTINKEMEMYTYADFMCVWKDDRGKRAGAIVDYKNGYEIIQAKKSAQLAFNAVALRCEIRRQGKDLDYVIGAIIQPNGQDDEIYKETLFTTKQLDTWEEKFLTAGHEILVKKNIKLKKGSWCKNCSAQGICPEYSKKLSRDADLQLLDPEELVVPDIEILPGEARLKIAKHSDDLIKFIKEVKKSILRDLMNGVSYTDVKAVQGSGRRSWIKDEATINIKMNEWGPGISAYELKLKPFTKVEKELITLLGKKEATAIMEQVTEKNPGNLKLVSIDDPRPAVKNALALLDDDDAE